MNGLVFGLACCALIWIGCSCVWLGYPWITPPWVDRWAFAADMVVIAVCLWAYQLWRML
jgi:hypothetical protein